MKLEDLYEDKKEIIMRLGSEDVTITITELSAREVLKYNGATTVKKGDNILIKHIVNDLVEIFPDDSKQDIYNFIHVKKPAIGQKLKLELLKLLGHDFSNDSDDEEDEDLDFDEE